MLIRWVYIVQPVAASNGAGTPSSAVIRSKLDPLGEVSEGPEVGSDSPGCRSTEIA